MSRQIAWAVVVLTTVFNGIAFGSNLKYIAGYQLPICDNAYPRPKTSLGGKVLSKPKGMFYCLESDIKRLSRPPLLFRKVLDNIGHQQQIKKVHLSAHYLNSPTVEHLLCELSKKHKFTLIISGQKGFVGRQHINRTLINNLLKCVNKVRLQVIGCDPFSAPNVSIYSICQKLIRQRKRGAWLAAHHIKYMIIELASPLGKKSSLAFFGSGNFARESLSINIEDWVGFYSDGESSEWWRCLTRFNADISNNKISVAAERYRSCKLKKLNELDGGEALRMVDYYLMPIEVDAFFEKIDESFRQSRVVYMVTQFFESNRLFELIEKHPNVNFKIFLDDAYVVTRRTGVSKNFVDPKKAKLFYDFVARNKNVKVRYLQTNHDFKENGLTNTVHARSIHFSGDGFTRSMVGSSHFRDGAFRNNSEQQFFVEGEFAAAHFQFFKELQDRSVSEQEVVLFRN